MSPEQARGKPVDKRSGHLGVRLRALRDADGPARVRRRRRRRTRSPRFFAASPTGRRCPAATPGSVRRLLRRCLAKDRERRLPRDRRRADRHRRRAGLHAASDVVGCRVVRDNRAQWRRACRGPSRSQVSPRRRRHAHAVGAVATGAVAGTAASQRRTRRGRVAVDSRRSPRHPFAGRRRCVRVHAAAGRRQSPSSTSGGSTSCRPTPVVGDRRRQHPVLFAGRPVDRVFRRRQAEEDSRRTEAQPSRSVTRDRSRRHMGRGRHDRFQAT